MGAGIAAVLGAAVGTLGTVATGWTSRSVAKMQMRVDSLRERREPRRSSYESFASAAVALHDHLEPWITFGRLLELKTPTGTQPWDGVVSFSFLFEGLRRSLSSFAAILGGPGTGCLSPFRSPGRAMSLEAFG